MIATSLSALRLLEPRRRIIFASLVILRALAGLLDLIAVILLGALVSLVALYSSSEATSSNGLLAIFIGEPKPSMAKELITVFAVSTIAAFFLKALISAWLIRQTTNFLADCEIQAAKQLLRNVSDRKLRGFELLSSTELIYAIKQGTNAAFGGLLQNVATLIAESFLFLSLAVVFLLVSPTTTGVLLAVMLGIGAILHFHVGRKIQLNSQKATLASQDIDNQINNLNLGFREIHAAGATTEFLNRIGVSRKNYARVEANQVFLQALPRYVIETAVIFLILAIGLVQVIDVDISKTASTLGIFLAGGMRIVAAMVPLQAALGQLRHFLPEANLALELFSKLGLTQIMGIDSPEASVHNNPRKPVVVNFKNVSFFYPKSLNFRLHEINFKIPAGNQVAFVGKSGAGKSTIADLALGLLEPQVGSIKIGNANASLYVETFPGRVGYVTQKPTKFPGDFVDNVALGIGKERVDTARVVECLKLANLFEFVDTLSESIYTDMSKTMLSGGQLQRLGLARALYSNPQFLVLDEVTASLDAESERAIGKSLEKLRGTITILIIAHRISTIRDADKIYVLEAGQIVESGTFRHLSRKGYYFPKYISKKL